MVKTKSSRAPRRSSAGSPGWARNLRTMMQEKGYNPRSLSLKAGLNATAVRDMLEGRTRFPRYDTVRSLADVLDTSPALLMGEHEYAREIITGGFAADLELLTRIIARLQETVNKEKRVLAPHDFAAMATTIYHSVQSGEDRATKTDPIRAQISNLLNYEKRRRK